MSNNMKCSDCGLPIYENSGICPYCGASIKNKITQMDTLTDNFQLKK